MKRVFKVFCVLIILIIAVVVYNVINNRNIRVVRQDVPVENLPDEFDGFTILQITDLHAKNFGEDEEKLAELIDAQDFDIIAITGDMQNIQLGDYENFTKLLEKIDGRYDIYYVPGNHGPYLYEGENGLNEYIIETRRKIDTKTDELTDFGKFFVNTGVKYLNTAYKITRGDKNLWISDLMTESRYFEVTGASEDDVKIALTHSPINEDYYTCDHTERLARYDLILAGNNHGGQWRLPIIGAIYTPGEYGAEWFPSKDKVEGLSQIDGVYQYISKGLGASGDYGFMRFRLFNAPEINLITLVKG